MKTKLKSVTFLLFLTLSISCSNPLDEACIGCQDDTIGLSKNLVQFSAENNSTTITTQGSGWWLSEIEFNGSKIDISGINRFSNQFKIDESEFTFERKSANEIFIQMTKNNSKQERKLWILLVHMNYGGHLSVIQSTE